MPAQVPCLWFVDEAEEAAEHYVSIFPGSRVTSVSRAPADYPAGRAGDVLTVEFVLDGQPWTALNGGANEAMRFTPAVSFQVGCRDQAEVDHYWERLSEGGQQGQCGWLTDRFGVSWQVFPHRLEELLADPDPKRARRAFEAMMPMRRIVLAELEAAADRA